MLGVGVFVWLEVVGVGCFLSFVGLFVLALAVVFGCSGFHLGGGVFFWFVLGCVVLCFI